MDARSSQCRENSKPRPAWIPGSHRAWLSFCLVATPPTSSSVNEGAFGAVNRDTPNPVIPVNPWYTLTSFTYARVQRSENPWPSRKRVDAATSVLWSSG